MKQTILRVGAIIVLGAGLGLTANSLSPRSLSWMARPEVVVPGEFITQDQAVARWHEGQAVFLDAREPADFAAGHIGNALNLPAQSFAEHFRDVAPLLATNSELILYCDGGECGLSHELADQLRQQGYLNLRILSTGWAGWLAAGGPVTRENQNGTNLGTAH